MDRRQFIKGVCATFAAVVLPIPKAVVKVAKRSFSCGLTLLELVRKHRSDDLLHIAEVLSESNEILKDAVWEKGDEVSH